jgi:uncharacterized protein YndB with AHSA1/START domain
MILNPELDLVLERTVDVPRELVWLAWTRPEHLKKWFTPAPWTTVDCEIDLRPGGIFRTVMRSPEGKDFPSLGCFLEIVPSERLVWTSVLGPGYRPLILSANEKECDTIPFTAVITLESRGQGTRYTATAIHADREGSEKHAKLGFDEGWGAAFDQLVALVRTLR